MIPDGAGVSGIVEMLALQEAGNKAERVGRHGSRLVRIPAASWQSDAIARAEGVVTVHDIAGLKSALENFGDGVIFLPHTTAITYELIEKYCDASSFDKVIVWEIPA
jgi:hypothetical protein